MVFTGTLNEYLRLGNADFEDTNPTTVIRIDIIKTPVSMADSFGCSKIYQILINLKFTLSTTRKQCIVSYAIYIDCYFIA